MGLRGGGVRLVEGGLRGLDAGLRVLVCLVGVHQAVVVGVERGLVVVDGVEGADRYDVALGTGDDDVIVAGAVGENLPMSNVVLVCVI